MEAFESGSEDSLSHKAKKKNFSNGKLFQVITTS